MNSRLLISFALLTVLGGAAHAEEQGSGVRGPVLGYVMDKAGAGIRPIYGIPGAATFGDVIDIGTAIEDAVIASAPDYAIGVEKGTGNVVLIPSLTSAQALPVPAAPDRIVISGSGSAAAVIYGSQQIVVTRGLPDAVEVSNVFNSP